MSPLDIEKVRAQLNQEFETGDWAKDKAVEVVLIAREMGKDPEVVLNWTIMKYNVVVMALKAYYDAQKVEIPDKGTITTLR